MTLIPIFLYIKNVFCSYIKLIVVVEKNIIEMESRSTKTKHFDFQPYVSIFCFAFFVTFVLRELSIEAICDTYI